jgi:transposase
MPKIKLHWDLPGSIKKGKLLLLLIVCTGEERGYPLMIEMGKVCSEGIGVDLGVKVFAAVSSGIKFKNINKTSKVKKLERRLKREQRKLSGKYHMRKQRGVLLQH